MEISAGGPGAGPDDPVTQVLVDTDRVDDGARGRPDCGTDSGGMDQRDGLGGRCGALPPQGLLPASTDGQAGRRKTRIGRRRRRRFRSACRGCGSCRSRAARRSATGHIACTYTRAALSNSTPSSGIPSAPRGRVGQQLVPQAGSADTRPHRQRRVHHDCHTLTARITRGPTQHSTRCWPAARASGTDHSDQTVEDGITADVHTIVPVPIIGPGPLVGGTRKQRTGQCTTSAAMAG